MRRALAVGVLLALAAASPAAAAKPCTRGKTLLQTRHVRVYEFLRPGLEIGQVACVPGRRRRPHVLAAVEGEIGDYATSFRVDGHFLAYVVRDAGSKDGGPGVEHVEVRDMRTGARIHRIQRLEQREASFVLAPSGALAVMSAGGRDPYTLAPVPPTLFTSDAAGRATIAEGHDIDVHSLAGAGRRIYWMQGGAPRTHVLSAPTSP